jgi:hypothetical protein
MAQGEATTADAVRAVLGATAAHLSDDEAIETVLNPGQNRYRLETLQLSVHSPFRPCQQPGLIGREILHNIPAIILTGNLDARSHIRS